MSAPGLDLCPACATPLRPEDRERVTARLGQRCTMCFGLGWVLDCNDLGKPGPRMAEFVRCFHPECTVSGQSIQSVAFKGVEFASVSRHPRSGAVMSVGMAA